MNGKYLLDTNVIIALLADEVMVRDNLASTEEVFILQYRAWRTLFRSA